jgi:hypothetical protein
MRFLLILFTILLVSCSSDQSQKLTKWKANPEKLSKETCIGESCAKVNISWPEFEGEAGMSINDAVKKQLMAYFYSDSVGATLERQVESYLKSFKEAKTEFPEMPGGWEMEVEAAISFDSLNTLSIFFEEFNFSGGAHPNSSNHFLNFERTSGQLLAADQLILDQVKMKELAESAFRKYHEVEDDVNLADDGRFFIPETGFFLPNAMGFKGKKFHLIYIPYEIGPYVLGYTELEFPLEELKGIVRM